MHVGHISTFQAAVLESRRLSVPTGRPLYTYRVSNVEFAELAFGLTDFLRHNLKYARLGDITRARKWFPGLFVLYCAEWWRREYDGSGWSWEPIVNSLGADPEGWSHAQRSVCIEHGLADWKIPMSQSRGFRFLSSVALQGGLPMKLLAAAEGKLGTLLSRVLRDAAGSRTRDNEIEEWIRHQASTLPDTYQRPEIYRLLTDIILAVLELKERTTLSLDKDPIARLDAADPEWRERFPLPIEDNQARQLLEQLVKEAATVRTQRSAAFAVAERKLEMDGADWTLRSALIIPEFVESSFLKATFGIAPEYILPRSISLQSEQGNNRSEMAATRLAGRETFRIARGLPLIADKDAAAEQWLSLLLADGTQKRVLTYKGEHLSPDLPWLFADNEGTVPTFVRQGSGVVPGSTGILCIPKSWIPEPQLGAEAHHCGCIIGLDRHVWRFRGSVKVHDEADATFKCRSGQAESDDSYVGWSGTRCTEIGWLSPTMAFRGIPRLCYMSEHSQPRPVAGQIDWRSTGRCITNPADFIGPVEGMWLSHGEIQWRSRLVLLGKAGRLRLSPGTTPCSGTLQFDDWRLAGAFSETNEISVSSHVSGDSLAVTVEYFGTGSPPEFCELSLLWMGNPQRARVRLPFPAFGVYCFDSKGQRLSNDHLLSIESMFGVRLVAFFQSMESASLQFTLCDKGKELDAANLKLASPQEGTRVEVRLVDHLSRIARMLANADDIDAYVRIELRARFSNPVSLRVARYSCELRRDVTSHRVFISANDSSSLTPDALADLVAEAIRLDEPGEESIRLQAIDSGGLTVGWRFPDDEVEGGPWLIFPGKDSFVQFRPLLWTVRDQTSGDGSNSELKTTLRTLDPHARADQLARSVCNLSKDFAADDWRLVEQTATQLCHLPLCALDLWKEFAKSYCGLAAIALRSHRFPAGFLDRFSNEMPAVWEMIPLSVWVETMRAFDAFEKTEALAHCGIDSRVEEIASLQPSLRVLLEVAQTLATGTPTKDVELVLGTRVDLSSWLFEGNDSHYQRLLRETSEAIWPTELNAEVAIARRGPLGRFLRPPCDLHHRDAVLNLPLLLATSVATGISVDSILNRPLRVIRRYQDFCPDWFTNAFDLTIARCISERAIKELEELRGAEALL